MSWTSKDEEMWSKLEAARKEHLRKTKDAEMKRSAANALRVIADKIDAGAECSGIVVRVEPEFCYPVHLGGSVAASVYTIRIPANL